VSRAEREKQLRHWFTAWSGEACERLVPVAGDASFRRYFRVTAAGRSLVLCDSPPEREKNPEFIAIGAGLSAAGVRVPRVLQRDLEQGFFALEDLGDQLLLPLLDAATVDARYHQALAMLSKLARADRSGFDVPDYDRAQLELELGLFPEWFCAGLLGIDLDDEFGRRWRALAELLCARALAQPQVLVHRDFHARNLMVLADDSLATIDFQDAVWGPITYDRCIPAARLLSALARFTQVRRMGTQSSAAAAGEAGMNDPRQRADYLVDFDWMGLQRHIKVLGIFSRLFLRDGKAAYLPDLPRVMAYVRDVLAWLRRCEPELAGFCAAGLIGRRRCPAPSSRTGIQHA
jgi:aminoglycoside/choline kinase family phosphotransferase